AITVLAKLALQKRRKDIDKHWFENADSCNLSWRKEKSTMSFGSNFRHGGQIYERSRTGSSTTAVVDNT
ncbi:MAG: hypothetical protein ACRECY_04030, partial [Phyllobacterium sp.]